MTRHLVAIGAAVAAIAGIGWGAPDIGDFTILHVFVSLFALLVVASALLWPSTGRDQRVELQMERLGWADRIKLPESEAREARAVRTGAAHASKAS